MSSIPNPVRHGRYYTMRGRWGVLLPTQTNLRPAYAGVLRVDRWFHPHLLYRPELSSSMG